MAPTNLDVDLENAPDALKGQSAAIANQCISVTPPLIKFPHDKPSLHIQKINVFNKSKRFVGFRVEDPGSQHFIIFYEKSNLHPGAEATVIVKCKPYDQKMCFSALRIHLATEAGDVLTIPLELLPSAEWFGLPKAIHMPRVSVGERSVKIINLPMPPPGEPPYHFFLSGDKPEALTVTPNEGKLGAPLGPKELILVYCPKEFTTLQCKINIHFPQIEFQPFELTVHMKCSPSEPAKKYPTPDMCKFTPKTKLPVTKLKIAPKPVENEIDDEDTIPTDVLTPAGIMKFLLQKGGKTSSSTRELKGPTGISYLEEEKIYKTKLNEFHDQLKKMEIHEKALVAQHTRVFLGQDPIDQNSQLWNEIQQQNEFIRQEYQKSLGMRGNDSEDLARTKLKLMRLRPIRNINYVLPDHIPSSPSVFNAMDPHDTHWVKRFILRRFIQAALRIITKKRADRRIAKLKILVQEVKASRKVLGKDGERLETDQVGISRALEKIHEMIKKSEASAESKRKKELALAEQKLAKRALGPAKPPGLSMSPSKTTGISKKLNVPTLEQAKSILSPLASKKLLVATPKQSKTVVTSENLNQSKPQSAAETEESVQNQNEHEEKSSSGRRKSSKSSKKAEKTGQDEELDKNEAPESSKGSKKRRKSGNKGEESKSTTPRTPKSGRKAKENLEEAGENVKSDKATEKKGRKSIESGEESSPRTKVKSGTPGPEKSLDVLLSPKNLTRSATNTNAL